MNIRRAFLPLTIAFALLPLVLPARQLAVDDPATLPDNASPEAAAVLQLVKSLDEH